MRRAIAVAIAWFTAVTGALALMSAGSTGAALTGGGFSPLYVGMALAVVTDASVGAVLIVRRPGNVVGLLLMVAANMLAFAIGVFVSGAVLTEQRGQQDMVAGLVALIGVLGFVPALIVAGPFLALIFPNGRLPGPRWRRPVVGIVAAIAAGSAIIVVRPGPIGGSFADNPFGVSGLAGYEALWAVAFTLIFGALLFALFLAFTAVIVRFRRAQSVERAQLKWFVVANVVVAVVLVLSIVDGGTNPTIFDLLGPFSLSLLPTAVGIAILRYRLFEIDRIISRTVSWAIVTGLLVAVFSGVEVGLQAVLAGFTQGLTLAVAGSTLVAAALFRPLRRRVQIAIDRRFDRARLDGQRTQDAFTDQMRDVVDMGRLRETLVATATEAVRPTGVSLWLRNGGPTKATAGFRGGG